MTLTCKRSTMDMRPFSVVEKHFLNKKGTAKILQKKECP